MWEKFEELTLKGYTLSRIREVFKENNIQGLEVFTDIPLLQRMIRTLRAAEPAGAD